MKSRSLVVTLFLGVTSIWLLVNYFTLNYVMHILALSMGVTLSKDYYSPDDLIRSYFNLAISNKLSLLQYSWYYFAPFIVWFPAFALYFITMKELFRSHFKTTKPEEDGRNAKLATYEDISQTSLITNDGHGAVLGSLDHPVREMTIKILSKKGFKVFDDYISKYLGWRLGLKLLLETTPEEHILGYAPSRSGKGVGLILPTLFNWDDSIIILDPKGELYEFTAGAALARGFNVYNLDLGNVSNYYNIFDELDWQSPDLFDKIDTIVNILIESSKVTGDNAIFTRSAVTLLRGIILYLFDKHKTVNLRDLAFAVSGLDVRTNQTFNMLDLLSKMKEHSNPRIRSVGNSFYDKANTKDPKTFNAFLGEIEKNLAIFMSPILGEISSKSDFVLRELTDINRPPTVLYLRIPAADTLSGRLNSASKLILNNIVTNTVYATGRRERIKGEWNKRNILFLGDEFPTLGKWDAIEEILSHAGGYGLKMYLIAQSDTQINRIYGHDNSIFANCTHRVIFAPNMINTAEIVSKHIGKERIYEKQENQTINKGKGGSQSISISWQARERDLLSASEIMRLPPDKSIVLTQAGGERHVIIANKIKFYELKEYSSLENLSRDYIKQISKLENYDSTFDDRDLIAEKLVPSNYLEKISSEELDQDVTDWLKTII